MPSAGRTTHSGSSALSGSILLAALTVTSSIACAQGFFDLRLCDGRYFPINYGAAGDAADICNSFCPASNTKIFLGSEIGFAVAYDGRSYRDLSNAYIYRTRVISDCTCDGRTAFGLVSVDVRNDPTLRAGDIVAMPDGLMIATGRRKSQFSPISGEMRKRLVKVRVSIPPKSVSVPGAAPVRAASR